MRILDIAELKEVSGGDRGTSASASHSRGTSSSASNSQGTSSSNKNRARPESN